MRWGVPAWLELVEPIPEVSYLLCASVHCRVGDAWLEPRSQTEHNHESHKYSEDWTSHSPTLALSRNSLCPLERYN